MAFNAESIIRAMMGSLGITPEHVARGMQIVETASAELELLKAEREAFKRGAAQMVGHFNAKLDAIEQRQIRIEALLMRAFPPQLSDMRMLEHDHRSDAD